MEVAGGGDQKKDGREKGKTITHTERRGQAALVLVQGRSFPQRFRVVRGWYLIVKVESNTQ